MQNRDEFSEGETSTTALIEKAREIEFCHADLESLARLLPTDDEALVTLLDERIEALQGRVFSHLWMAAHWAGRRVPARLLRRGAELLPDSSWLAPTAPLCEEREGAEGEICHCLLAAVESGHMGELDQLLCLVAAARSWRTSRGEEAPFPESMARLSRKLARRFASSQPNNFQVAVSLLEILAYLTKDEDLIRIIEDRFLVYREDLAERMLNDVYGDLESLKDFVPERRPERVLSGYQVRRAVAKTGRNEPCPCGSGLRYKKCCLRADRKKLSRSSEVAGKTLDDLEKEKEERLSFESLSAMKRHEVMRLDPARIGVDMIKLVIQRLVFYGELDHTLTIFEKSSHPDWDGWEDAFEWVFMHSMEAKRFDLTLQLAEMFPGLQNGGAVDLEFIRARGDHAAILDSLESHCRALLHSEEEDEDSGADPGEGTDSERHRQGTVAERWAELAHCLMRCDLPHFQIAFARGILPLAPRREVDFLLEHIEGLRESVGLSRFDVSEEIAQMGDQLEEKNLIEEMEERLKNQFSDQLENASAKLDHRNQELAELKRSLRASSARAAEAEAVARKKEAALEALKSQAAPGDEDRIAENEKEITELRDRMRMLKSEVKRKHDQRNELRRELRQARREAVESRVSTGVDAEPHRNAMDDEARAAAAEEALLEAEDASCAEGFLTPRVPVFPEHFLDRIKPFPVHVQSAVFHLVGRLAAGDASAFAGVRRLKLTRDLLRQRFSGYYRLIFRVRDDQLEIVDVIHRRDLERWLQK